MAKKPDFREVSVLNAPVLGDITVSGGKASITGIGEKIPLEAVTSFLKKAFNTGTASIQDVDLAGVVALDNTQFRLNVRLVAPTDSFLVEPEVLERSYIVSTGTGATTAIIRDLFITEINQDTNADVTASDGGGSVLTLTAKKVDFDFAVDAPSGSTVVVTTPHVAPAGTTEIVQQFDSVNASATANYDTYEIVFNRDFRSAAVGGSIVKNEFVLFVFSDSLITPGHTQFDARIQGIFTNTVLDAVKQDGAIAGSVTTILASTTLTQLSSGTLLVDASAGAVVLTLEDSVVFGERIINIISTEGGGNTITLLRVGGDTVNGGASVLVPKGKGSILSNDGAGAYFSRDFA